MPLFGHVLLLLICSILSLVVVSAFIFYVLSCLYDYNKDISGGFYETTATMVIRKQAQYWQHLLPVEPLQCRQHPEYWQCRQYSQYWKYRQYFEYWKRW